MWQLKQEEETRKVQFTGGSTYIISLPKSWIAQNQIKKGSFIRLRAEEGGLLTIAPESSAVKKRTDEVAVIVCKGDDSETVIRKLVAAYLAGYNSILIKHEKQLLSAKQRHVVKNFVRHSLVGTEIVTDTSAQITLQVLLSYPELTVQNALRRMSIITTSMHKDAIAALRANDKLLAKEVISTDNEVDRFNLYVIRLLRGAIQNPRITKEVGLSGGSDCLGYRLVCKSVERTADHAATIAQNVLLLNQKLTGEIGEQIEQMSNISVKMFDSAIESLFRQDFNSAETILRNLREIEDLEKKAIVSAQDFSSNDSNLRLVIESVRRTAEYASDIAEIVLNLTIDSILG